MTRQPPSQSQTPVASPLPRAAGTLPRPDFPCRPRWGHSLCSDPFEHRNDSLRLFRSSATQLKSLLKTLPQVLWAEQKRMVSLQLEPGAVFCCHTELVWLAQDRVCDVFHITNCACLSFQLCCSLFLRIDELALVMIRRLDVSVISNSKSYSSCKGSLVLRDPRCLPSVA